MRNCRYCREEIPEGSGVPGGFCDQNHKWLFYRPPDDGQAELQLALPLLPPRPGIWGRTPIRR